MNDQATETKERGILFSAEMVRALLDLSKTQTRRIIKPSKRDAEGICIVDDKHPFNLYGDGIVDEDGVEWPIACPYGKPGDRLWVRETWALRTGPDYEHSPRVFYQDGTDKLIHWMDGNMVGHKYGLSLSETDKWRRSIHMPRWASRITLGVTDVRVERVQEIRRDDRIAEGIRIPIADALHPNHLYPIHESKRLFRELWDSINAKRGYSWESNPWVWAITFKRIRP